ncbi:MAG TPA: extracellular solute-binding protein, partial [Actinomycetes bacterium]|nr:extracellular solute-binding protein [Actinomycetes bacterium]
MTEDNTQPFPVAGVRETGLSRRHFLRGVGASGAAVAGAGLLAACGNDTTPSGEQPTDQSTIDNLLNVANWPLYIDTKRVDDVKTYPTLEAFEAETGIDVTYTEPINDNEEYFAKIRPILAAGNDIGQDIIIMTDWMASNLINIGYLQKLDKSNIPNMDNIVPKLKSPVFDPNRDYSIPWQSGVTGIAYDSGQVGEVSTINDLLTNPDLSGAITVL